MKTATYTVHADQHQALRWNRTAAAEGYASTGGWIAAAVDAYLRARARAGLPLPLCWRRGRFKVLLMDGREVELWGSVSPPFAHFQGSSYGPDTNKPRTLICLKTGQVIATLRSARQCRALAAELAPVWLRDRDLAAGIIERHNRESS